MPDGRLAVTGATSFTPSHISDWELSSPSTMKISPPDAVLPSLVPPGPSWKTKASAVMGVVSGTL